MEKPVLRHKRCLYCKEKVTGEYVAQWKGDGVICAGCANSFFQGNSEEGRPGFAEPTIGHCFWSVMLLVVPLVAMLEFANTFTSAVWVCAWFSVGWYWLVLYKQRKQDKKAWDLKTLSILENIGDVREPLPEGPKAKKKKTTSNKTKPKGEKTK